MKIRVQAQYKLEELRWLVCVDAKHKHIHLEMSTMFDDEELADALAWINYAVNKVQTQLLELLDKEKNNGTGPVGPEPTSSGS